MCSNRKIEFFETKRILNDKWKKALNEFNLNFLEELENSTSNNWLNTIVLTSRKDRDKFLKLTNKRRYDSSNLGVNVRFTNV